MDSTVRKVTHLIHQLVIHQTPRDSSHDKNKFDILGRRGGCGDVVGGGFGGFAHGDIHSGGFNGGSDGHHITGLHNHRASFLDSALDLGTDYSSLRSNRENDQKTIIRSRPVSSSRDVGRKVTTDDERNLHQSSGQVRAPSLDLSTNHEHQEEEPEDIEQRKTRRLACPYVKDDPKTYGYRCRSGFYEIHRLKEHLYRAHKQPPHCFRCGETFSDESHVKAHLSRPAQICDFVAGVSIEGLTNEQVQKLKSKKRKSGVTTNEEKWQDIFKIVFPNKTHCPDPYYSCFDDRSNDQNLLSMIQNDVESLFSDIPPESAECLFTKLEPVCGHLEKPKRRKVLDAVGTFFLERIQQFKGKGIFQSKQNTVHPNRRSIDSFDPKTTAPETEGQVLEAQCAAAQKGARDPSQSLLETTSISGGIEHWRQNSFQKRVECNLLNLPDEQIFSEVLLGSEEIFGKDDHNRPNDQANTERLAIIPNSTIESGTNDFENFVPSQDSSSFLDALDVDSILNDLLENGSGHDNSAPVEWVYGHADL